jgi:hypothetical protein
MRALIDDNGGIYLFGPGVFVHMDGERFAAWRRFTGDPVRVTNRQRDLIGGDCLTARQTRNLQAIVDERGGIYLFGPGIFTHLSPTQWNTWSRFTGPATRVSNAERDIIGEQCLTARQDA